MSDRPPTPNETQPDWADPPVRVGIGPFSSAIKHAIDRVAATLVLILLSPALLVIALLIKRDSPGPALFQQTRAGWYGRPFTLMKFRTMRTDADPFGDSPSQGEDPRITRLGRFLRESSVDELPQLINVVRGEMSLVGPRPLFVQQIAEWDARQRCRLLVKPGLTGMAQVFGRASVTLERKLEYDLEYVQRASLWFDAWLIWRTVGAVLFKRGLYQTQYSEKRAAYRGGEGPGASLAPPKSQGGAAE